MPIWFPYIIAVEKLNVSFPEALELPPLYLEIAMYAKQIELETKIPDIGVT